jgi:hypothetical protein
VWGNNIIINIKIETHRERERDIKNFGILNGKVLREKLSL